MHGNGCGEGLVSTLVPGVAHAVKFSHEFPTNSAPAYTYYNDFAKYQAVMNGTSSEISTADVDGRSTAKLFASKHIARPQNFFTARPDNSHAPFLPILKSKANALVDLQDCTFEADPETGDYTHPYLSELEDYGKRLGDYK
ncbi:hypothetical protein ECG_00462 [Echinococcus granulosus]|nr:hypothetical protein ECG_00462 [Echinococcus granulosus]